MKQGTQESTDWFENWFDSPYYHILYGHRDEGEAKQFIDNLIEYIQLPPGSRVLDMACGKGRHVEALVDHGMDVVGYDLSPQSIATASARIPEAEFRVQDMRLEWPHTGFDLIGNFFTSMGYFQNPQDDDRMLRNTREAINTNGMLVIDYMNSVKVIEQMVTHETITKEGILFDVSRAVVNGYAEKTIVFSDQGSEHHFQEHVRLLQLNDLERMLSKVGFSILDTFGDYQLNDFDPDTSDRLIVLARQ